MNDDNYDDIINLPRPISSNHTPMPMINRAAQFAPFSALNGHSEAVDKSARVSGGFVELDNIEWEWDDPDTYSY